MVRQPQSGELALAPATNAAVAVAAAARSAIAVVAGLGFTCAVAAVIWAITPASGASPIQLLRGGVAAYALAHFAPITIGQVGLTLSPLLLTTLFAAMLIGSIGRGSGVARTASDELVSILIGTLTYAVMVGLLVGWLATPGSVNPLVGVCAGGVALVSLTIGTVIKGDALRELLLSLLPSWFAVAIRASTVAILVVVGGAALALAVSLAVSFGTAATLTDASTTGVTEEIGLTLAGLAFLPNAIAAAIGYVSGTGFDIGRANYSPFGSVQAEIPSFPILASVPANSSWSVTGLSMLLVPLIAAVCAGICVTRGVATRRERLYAIGVAAALAALVSGLLVGIAGGGIEGGAWASIGASAVPVATVIFLAVLIAGGVWTAAAGGSQVRWKPAPAAGTDAAQGASGELNSDALDSEALDSEELESEELDSDSVGDTEPTVDAAAETQPEVELDVEVEPDAEAESELLDPEPEPEPEPDAVTEAEAEAEPDAETAPAGESEADAETEPDETEPAGESEQGGRPLIELEHPTDPEADSPEAENPEQESPEAESPETENSAAADQKLPRPDSPEDATKPKD